MVLFDGKGGGSEERESSLRIWCYTNWDSANLVPRRGFDGKMKVIVRLSARVYLHG